MGPRPLVTVVGGGLAGVEAAWAAATRGAQALLYEMRPGQRTPAHQTGDLAELVCSNSLKSARLTNAAGLLKAEMARLGSVLLPIARECAVPAGEALAVDPPLFASTVTDRVHQHPEITVIRQEVTEVPEETPVVIATGPLTSDSLANSLAETTGTGLLRFFDAVAPTVTLESIDQSQAFRASRRNRSMEDAAPAAVQVEDYINCPMSREEYDAFLAALLEAEQARPHLPEEASTPFFEACIPVEELARRGPRTLAYGPLRPVGLTDPRTGRRPHAVVQLRQQDRAGTLWGLVGFQTRLRWPDQKRVFRMIPGLQQAEFVRYGVMHRNTYLCSPEALLPTCELRARPGIFVAGQLTGVEGYVESAAIGILAGLNAVRLASGRTPVIPPPETVLGSLCRYLTETDPKVFAPMNANYAILPELSPRVADKRARAQAHADRSLAALGAWMKEERLDGSDS